MSAAFEDILETERLRVYETVLVQNQTGTERRPLYE